MINNLSKGSTVSVAYYANELRKLREALKSKRRGKLRRGVLLLHDNAPAHTAGVATSVAAECGFELLPHPPYSLDLAPSDFYLFPLSKEHLRGRQYASDNDIIQSVGVTLLWFRSYLSGRSYRVWFAGAASGTVHVICSVPRGSVLGPRLFIVYSADLADKAVEHDINFHGYADALCSLPT